MASKLERDKQKLVQDKCQQILTNLLKDEDNKYCVDCDAKGPRWASWNLGIFLCIRCAGIHRNLGVHISRVKSVNLDSWTPEQVGSIMNMGNSKARAVYEANLPDNFNRPQSDSPLESFIRAKYELKKYIAKEWSETPPKPAFDIDELLRKEKENKKNKIKPIGPIGLSSDSCVPSNPLPRPGASTSNNASSSRSLQKPVVGNKIAAAVNSNNSASIDLLGLNLGETTSSSSVTAPVDEPFGFFASATTTTTTTSNNTNKGLPQPSSGTIDVNNKTLEDEEKDFFSQTVPEEKKLTKESILSLYSQSNGRTNGAPGVAAPPTTGLGSQSSNSLAGQFAGLNFGGIQSAVPNTLANTNPFLASSNSSTTATNPNSFGAFSTGMNTSTVSAPTMTGLSGINWPGTGAGASANVATQSFSMAPQANPFVNKSAPTQNFNDPFDFSSLSAAPSNGNGLNSLNSIPAFANFSNMPPTNTSMNNENQQKPQTANQSNTTNDTIFW